METNFRVKIGEIAYSPSFALAFQTEWNIAIATSKGSMVMTWLY